MVDIGASEKITFIPAPQLPSEQASLLIRQIETKGSPELKPIEEKLARAKAVKRLFSWVMLQRDPPQDDSQYQLLKSLNEQIQEDWLNQAHRSGGQLITSVNELEGYLEDIRLFLESSESIDPLKMSLDHSDLQSAYSLANHRIPNNIFHKFIYWKHDTGRQPIDPSDVNYQKLVSETKAEFPKELADESDPTGVKRLAVWVLDGYRFATAVQHIKQAVKNPHNEDVRQEVIKNKAEIQKIMHSPYFSDESLALFEAEVNLQKEKSILDNFLQMRNATTIGLSKGELGKCIERSEERHQRLRNYRDALAEEIDAEFNNVLGESEIDFKRRTTIKKKAKRLTGNIVIDRLPEETEDAYEKRATSIRKKRARDARARFGKKLDEFETFWGTTEGRRFRSQLINDQFLTQIDRRLREGKILRGKYRVFADNLKKYYPTMAVLGNINPSLLPETNPSKSRGKDRIGQLKDDEKRFRRIARIFSSFGSFNEEDRQRAELILDLPVKKERVKRSKKAQANLSSSRDNLIKLPEPIPLDSLKEAIEQQQFEERVDVQTKVHDPDYYCQAAIDYLKPSREYNPQSVSKALKFLRSDSNRFTSTLRAMAEKPDLYRGSFSRETSGNAESLNYMDKDRRDFSREKREITVIYDRTSGEVKSLVIDSHKKNPWESFTFVVRFRGDSTTIETNYDHPYGGLMNHTASKVTFLEENGQVSHTQLETTKRVADDIKRDKWDYPPEENRDCPDLQTLLFREREYILMIDRIVTQNRKEQTI